MPNRWKDWLAQAEHDLDHARDSQRAGKYDWACFAAQQASEKAAKALHLFHGQDAWGHATARLLAALPEPAPPELVDKGRFLDTFYIPTRYPNGHAEGPSYENYGPLHSSQAIRHAGDILNFVHQAVAEA